VKNSLLHRDPDEIAGFLRRDGTLPDGRCCGEHLDHRAVGEYLGSVGGRDEESRKLQRSILGAYTASFDLQGLTLIRALRVFLGEFRLPGEAQVIDRVMSVFSDAYVRDNPSIFSSPDVAYILSFAAIMLNTDLHKAGVKKKMTREQFVTNMRGLEAGGRDLPLSLLQGVFSDIASLPLALDTDPSFLTFYKPAREGWLVKRCAGTIPRWKKRYFLLTDGVLYYFSSPLDVGRGRPRCILPLDSATLELNGPLCLRIVPRQPEEVVSTTTTTTTTTTTGVSSGYCETFGTPKRQMPNPADASVAATTPPPPPPPPLPHLFFFFSPPQTRKENWERENRNPC